MIRCNLSILMAERNIKMSQLVSETGISKTALTDLVYNRSKAIQFNTINKLCIFLDVTPSELISFFPFDLSISELTLSERTETGFFNNTSEKCTSSQPILTVELNMLRKKPNVIVPLVFFVMCYNGLEGTPDEYEFKYVPQETDEHNRQIILSLPIPFRTDLENTIGEQFRKQYDKPDVKITIRW